MTASDSPDELQAVRRELAAIPAQAARGVQLAIEPAARVRSLRIPVPFLSKEPTVVYETHSYQVARTEKKDGQIRITVGEETNRSFTPAELRGALAHEVAHVSLGHLDRSTRAGVTTLVAYWLCTPRTAFLGAALAFLLAVRGQAVAGLLVFAAGLVAWLAGVALSQRNEFAADALAVTWVGACMLDTVTRIKERKERKEPLIQRLRLHTHPTYQQRIDRIQKALAGPSASDARRRKP